MSEKILLALSGGVDSAMCVHFLKEQGFDVYGYTFVTGDDEAKKQSIIDDAKKVAKFFDIPHKVEDLSTEFKSITIANFLDEYLNGRTPNPCVLCNRTIKFPYLIKAADEMGIDKVATGHYVRQEQVLDEVLLLRGVDDKKDQSYVLYGLSTEILARCYFPLGDKTKDEIRSIAFSIDLPVAQKKDSQEICFIPDDNYRKFILDNVTVKIKNGLFMSEESKVLGDHDGIPFYTIGQRKGLGLALGRPAYVYKLDSISGNIYIGDEQLLYKNECIAKNVNILKTDVLGKAFSCDVKIRYKSPLVSSKVIPVDDSTVQVIFDSPQRSVTPGQSVVFYDGDRVIGGGIIE